MQQALEEVVAAWPRYGYRRITHQVRREGWTVNHKRVEHLEIVRPEQVWVSDITYIGLPEECVYLAVLVDVFILCIRGWHLGRSLDQSLTLRALERALAQYTPEIHHSIKVSSMQPPPIQRANKRLGHRSVWQKWERRGKMAMPSG